MNRLCAAVLFLALPGNLSALAQETAPGIEWEQTIIAIKTEGNTATNVIYRFRNTTDRPVNILSTTASCGCTIPATSKSTYAPGESGELPVAHKPRPGPGTRSYRINVQTDEGGGREHVLTLQVTHNPRLTIQPRVINWAKDEPRSAKNVQILLKKDDVIKVTGAQAVPDVLDIAVTDGPEPGQQTLVVTPKPGTALVPGRVRVQLTTEPPLPPSMDTQFFAVLR